jgi:hypothetical protein
MDYYRILDVALQVECPDAALRAEVRHRLDPFAAATVARPDIALAVRHVSSAEPPATVLRCAWRGEVATGLVGATYTGPGVRRLTVEGYGWLDWRERRSPGAPLLDAELCAARDDRKLPWDGLLLPLLAHGLSQRGWCPLHAASLKVDFDDVPRGVLLVAPSQTGKSTTSLALARAPGWQLMSDDVALVRCSDGGTLVWGFPRDCHVRAGSLAVLPWLRDLPLRPTYVPGTSLLTLAELQPASQPVLAPLPPALVVCLQRPNPDLHRLRPIDPATALAHVAHEAVASVDGPNDPAASRHFATLAELVRRTPACTLSAGPRLAGLDRLLLDFLAGDSHARGTHRAMAACAV